MKLSLITVKRRPDSDDVSRRETLLEGAELRVGRGADVDVNLPDVNVAYHHATISESVEGLMLTAVGGSVIEVDGSPVDQVHLAPGVTARIGSYDLQGEDAPDHADRAVALSKVDVEEVVADDLPQAIVQTLPSRRRLSWVLALAVLGVFLAWPLYDILQRQAPDPNEIRVTGMIPASQAAQTATQNAVATGQPPEAAHAAFSPMEAAWLSGPMSRVHAGLEEDCGACHERPFEMTTNQSCLNCHAEVAHHGDVEDHPVLALDNFRCAACHKEHVGGYAPIERASTVCTDCHADLKTLSANTTLLNVADFDRNHPQFRPTLVTGVELKDGELVPTVVRAPLDASFPLVEQSGLKFPHNVHLNEEGVRGLGRASDKTWDMTCQSCHVAEADGSLMRPIEMERDCGYCHELTFKPDNVDILRELPHARPEQVSEIMHDYYAARVLEGGVTIPGAPRGARRRPGTKLSDEDRAQSLEWAAATAERELDGILGTRLCGDCHIAEKDAEPDERGRGVWRVQGALLQRHWMPKSVFEHGPHFAMDCTSCHEATDSTSATDVLMPGIELCQDCHKGEFVTASASSECLSCHEFHIEGYGPMSTAHGDAMVARRKATETVEVKRGNFNQ
ncbi:MAG: cytochrome c3 family protein [Pseudomonadota bacterium]